MKEAGPIMENNTTFAFTTYGKQYDVHKQQTIRCGRTKHDTILKNNKSYDVNER